jgi:hypothetical protein
VFISQDGNPLVWRKCDEKGVYAERDWGRLERALAEMERRLKDVLTDAEPSGASPEPPQRMESTGVLPEKDGATEGNVGAS